MEHRLAMLWALRRWQRGDKTTIVRVLKMWQRSGGGLEGGGGGGGEGEGEGEGAGGRRRLWILHGRKVRKLRGGRVVEHRLAMLWVL